MAFDCVRRCFYLQISFISLSDSDLLLRARSEPIPEMETGLDEINYEALVESITVKQMCTF